MALKALLLRRKIDEKNQALKEQRTKADELQVREAELEASIDEAQTDEEKAAVEQAVEEFERERAENEATAKSLQEEIAAAERELAELERSAPVAQGAAADEGKGERKDKHQMNTRTKFFGMTMEQRDAFFAREEVKEFLERVRSFKGQSRAVNGSELLVPDVMLELLRDNIIRYSKLISKVNLKAVKGTARQNIAGTVPEGVWTEMIGKLNELTISFNQVEVDGYKVGGFIVVPNSTLEDSNINLAAEILDALGQAIGFALDKAILYGKGTKMPMGIVTRLAQTAKPSDYGTNMPEWKDLHTTNMTKIDSTATDAKFVSALVLAAANAKSKYANGSKFWAMNETTYAKIVSKMVAFNAAGAAVAQVNNTMPVIGGEIVLLDFVPDGDIVGGYGSTYLLVERAGTSLAQSEHVQFIEDNTVFKGTARYDGLPVIAQDFVAINIENKAPTTSMEFAEDKANATPETPVV